MLFILAAVIVIGSSPRVWGQVVCMTLFIYGLRIIPTRVGTSWNNISIVKFAEDHPHACGDKVDMWRTSLKIPSSSPRVWGQGQKSTSSHRRRRIIPTRVGTSSPFSERIIFVKDHPHACGDKEANFPDMYDEHRIIPTRVGTRH